MRFRRCNIAKAVSVLLWMNMIVTVFLASLTAGPLLAGAASPTVIAIVGGYDASYALKSDGTVWAWGQNDCGQLGNGSDDISFIPVQVSGLSGVTAIDAAGYSAYALKSDGTVWAWGDGQLGNNSAATSDVPVQVSGLSGVTALATGGAYAMKSDGTVWAWGDNDYGQLGNNSYGDCVVPVQVSCLSGATAIVDAGVARYALKSDGTVWDWGSNVVGELGNGTTATSYTPEQVPGLSGVTAIAASDFSAYVLKSDGTVWAWGENCGQNYDQIGSDPTSWDSEVPVQVPGLSGITAIAATGESGLALKSDGTVWAWGLAGFGTLGDGTNKDIDVPVQVSGLPSAPATPISPSNAIASFTIGLNSYTAGGHSVSMDAASFISDGRTFVPVSYLAEALGAQTIWDKVTQSVTVTKDGTTIKLFFGSNTIITNGTESQMDNAPVISNRRAYLPARYVAEALGYTVSWDAATQTVNIQAKP